MNIIRIVAAVLDTAKLTLYKTDGTTVILNQGDSRIRRIIDEATPQILKQGYADVDMASEIGNPYKDFEEKSTRVRLFRVAKDKLKSLFGIKTDKTEAETAVQEMCVGAVPQGTVDVAVSVTATTPVIDATAAKSVTPSVINEIMAHAQPVSHPEFEEEGLDKQAPITDGNGITPNQPTVENSTDTIIAIVDNNKIVPGMERIKSQFDKAAKLGSVVGVENFLARLGKVIHERKHSVEDLLKFLERGDLPIADDGCILIYKVLNKVTANWKAYPLAKYVDCHSGNVPQWVGARVHMAESLVDPNRRNECSNGLHVARRGYIRAFGGTVCVMAKLAPEDVIAVPDYDANKMRVCGYNIIFELTPEHYELLRANRPITETESGKIMLAKALRGDHTKVTHMVEITGPKGGGIKVTSTERPAVEAMCAAIDKAFEKPITPVTALADKGEQAEPVSPKDVVKEVETLKETTPVAAPAPIAPVPETPAKPETHLQRIMKLAAITPMDTLTAHSILAIQKKAKKGWAVLKVPDEIVARVLELTGEKK